MACIKEIGFDKRRDIIFLLPRHMAHTGTFQKIKTQSTLISGTTDDVIKDKNINLRSILRLVVYALDFIIIVMLLCTSCYY